MSKEYELFHGAEGDNILSILEQGAMRPDAHHEIYYSQRFEDALQHGADMKRGAALAFKARVTVPDGASIQRVQKPGNPLTVLITTALPLSVTILELYARVPNSDGFTLEIVKGVHAIRGFLRR